MIYLSGLDPKILFQEEQQTKSGILRNQNRTANPHRADQRRIAKSRLERR
jgi:hypothetical protein